MLYYNTLAAYLKTSKFQLLTKRYFPVIVMLLLLLETLMVLTPTLGIRSSIAEQHCVYGDNSVEARSRVGWLYNVLFPYWLPFVAAVGPFIYLSIRLKEGHIIEPHKSQVMVSLAVVGGYFVFYLLYYILMIARQVEFLVDTSTSMQRLIGNVKITPPLSHSSVSLSFSLSLKYFISFSFSPLSLGPSLKIIYNVTGVSVMFITRPMFVLIGHIWHISVPLSVLLLDKELRKQWPAKVMLRGRYQDQEDCDNSIVMSDVGLGNNINNNRRDKTEVSNTFSVMMLENREFHNNYSVNVH